MNKCFLFSFIHEVEVEEQGNKKINTLVIFSPYRNIAENDLYVQLREYFYENLPPDQLIIICPEYNCEEIGKLFEITSEIYQYIPFYTPETIKESVSAVCISAVGHFNTFLGTEIKDELIDEIYRRGMTDIFNVNGGLIISQSAHHFVFPSGKHCDRFLRPGNVLIHGPEIIFLASALIKRFKGRIYENIYCDTSSINSLAYCFVNLLKELHAKYDFSVKIESFGSYKLFEESKFTAERDSLFLISSSTSGSILRRMTEDKKRNINLENIAIIYGLDVDKAYAHQVVCDLGRDNDNPFGCTSFESYNISKGEICAFCQGGSRPVDVQGDVFLLEKPIVSGQMISLSDAPPFLKKLSGFYDKIEDKQTSIFKCFYKDNSQNNKKYELYIDVEYILSEWGNRNIAKHPFKNIFQKLDRFVIQQIPAALKYMVVLADEASERLAQIIAEIMKEHGLPFDPANIIAHDKLSKIKKDGKGTIAVISSSIVTGRNLLFLSRALRDYETNYRRIFFTFMSRTPNSEHLEFLESNLGLGEYGKLTHKIINVETIFCSDQAHTTTWHQELDNLKVIEEFCDEKGKYATTQSYCQNRIQELDNSGLDRGLVNNLFFPSVIKDEPLKIRKGFAFAPNTTAVFIQRATQSEIYFIMSSILNEIRSKGRLVQTEYVRNVIDPGNFIRFNDGIIQACLLRAASSEELRYDLTEELSLKMRSLLGDMIIHIGDYHAEALSEFFYAIACRKMKLKSDVLKECIELLEAQEIYQNTESILKGVVEFVKEKVCVLKPVTDRFTR